MSPAVRERDADDAPPCRASSPETAANTQVMCGSASSRSRIHAAVDLLVRLRPRRPDRRAATAVQQLELDAGRVDGLAHQAAEGVDLANQMSLCRAADGRITGHMPNSVRRQRAQRDPAAQAHRGMRGLAAGVARADDDDVRSHLPMQNLAKISRSTSSDDRFPTISSSAPNASCSVARTISSPSPTRACSAASPQPRFTTRSSSADVPGVGDRRRVDDAARPRRLRHDRLTHAIEPVARSAPTPRSRVASSSALHADGRSHLLATTTGRRGCAVPIAAPSNGRDRSSTSDAHVRGLAPPAARARCLPARSSSSLSRTPAVSISVTARPPMSHALGQQIARRAGHRRDDRAARAEQRVEQQRLADVRRADDRHPAAFAKQPPSRAPSRAARDT